MNRETLIGMVLNIGYQAYIPRCSSWKLALVASNENSALYILIRKNGIDFKLYATNSPPQLDSEGMLYTNDGELIRNHYNHSVVNLHTHALKIAEKFYNNILSINEIREPQGVSWRETSANKQSNHGEYSALDIYEAISIGDGEDAYLGDGMWISQDGTMEDRGR